MNGTDEKYNGWTNRETWAVALWLGNDQGTDEMARERVAYVTEPYERADEIRSLVDVLLDPDEQLMTPETIITWLRDIGSLYRVNWTEVAASFVDGES